MIKRRKHSLYAVVAVTCTATAFAQHPDPNSPRYKGVIAIEAFLQTTTDEALRSFAEKKLSPEFRGQMSEQEVIDTLRTLREAFRGATVQGAMPIGPFAAEISFDTHGKSASDELTFELQGKPPHRFTKIDYPKPESTDTGQLSFDEMVKRLSDYLDGLAAKDEFSGAVLLAKNGKPLFKKAYGLASKRYNVPNRIDTKFNLGSMNKMFTGVAICQLAQQGKLSFDDPIIKHVPDYPNKEVAEKVTIHHLLTHTSGLGSYWNEKYERDWKSIRTVEGILATFVDESLAFEPGERFQYSNSGPIVLGLIIEKITGKTYYEYVLENIHQPTGMYNTDCYEVDRPTPNLAIGYTNWSYDETQDDGPKRNNLFLHSIKGGPAGGGYSTVEDLLKFANAIQNHTLLNAEYTNTLLEGKVAMGPGAMYAYLFGDKNRNGHRSHGHNGGAPGISSNLSFYPELGVTFAVMANYDGVAMRVSRFIEKMLGKIPATDMRELAGSPDEELNFKPSYRMGVGLEIHRHNVRISFVEDKSPAKKAGLLADDVIVSINGKLLGSDAIDLFNEVLSSPDAFVIKVRRGDQTLDVTLTPEKSGN